MPMPSVHHEINMKISCVIRPNPDFGLTVVMGESHIEEPHEESSSATASSRSAVGTRESRLLRMDSFTWVVRPGPGRGPRRRRPAPGLVGAAAAHDVDEGAGLSGEEQGQGDGQQQMRYDRHGPLVTMIATLAGKST